MESREKNQYKREAWGVMPVFKPSEDMQNLLGKFRRDGVGVDLLVATKSTVVERGARPDSVIRRDIDDLESELYKFDSSSFHLSGRMRAEVDNNGSNLLRITLPVLPEEQDRFNYFVNNTDRLMKKLYRVDNNDHGLNFLLHVDEAISGDENESRVEQEFASIRKNLDQFDTTIAFSGLKRVMYTSPANK